MKNLLMAVFVSFLALGLTAGDAEARRLGGGKSFGIQRQAVTPKPAAPARQATAPTNPASQAAPKRNWMGPIAGLAAGLGIAALLSHFGLGGEMANLVMIGLLAIAAIALFKLLFRRQGTARPAMQYAGTGPSLHDSPAEFTGSGSAGLSQATTVPAGFDAEAFLRVAKLNFVRLQAANDTRNIDDLREFTSPELFAEIRMQMDERDEPNQQTDVVRLDATLLEVVTEGSWHIASVRFDGLIRESANGPAVPFGEVWHLRKPVEGNQGWVVAGIQQPEPGN